MKEKKHINVLNYLFFCIVINMIPTIMLAEFSISSSVYTIANGIIYILEILIMLYAVRNNIRKVSSKTISLLLIFFLLQVLTQLINILKQGTMKIEDIIHIISVCINIFVFVLCLSHSNIEKKDVYVFMKKMVILGVISCIYNMIKNVSQILNLTSIASSYSASISSFFPNRNQFGIFLIIMILSNLYVKKTNNKKIYKIIEIFFIFNLILTMSRNSIIGIITIYVVKFYIDFFTTKRISKRKMLSVTFVLLFIIAGMYIVISNQNYINIVERLFIRTDTLSTGSGRITLWKNMISMVIDDNLILGLGRFNAIELNKTLYNSPLEDFHSLYVETFVTYGIVGILILYLLFINIIKRIKKSCLDLEYKNILIISIITFLAISIFETTTCFSIGYADMMGLIYFIALPLLISNIDKENKL